MDKNVNAILIHDKDNVVTVTEMIPRDSIAGYIRGGNIVHVKVINDIPRFHKVAVADIKKNGHVYKYGQLIGEAITNIACGEHVHDHNIVSPP
ncbi:UxaA family hydrolase [Thermodesulfobacteriota bacterium]